MAKAPNLARYSIEELRSIIKDAEKLIAKQTNEEKKQARKAAEDAARKHGYSLDALVGGASASRSSKPKNPPRYRNPSSPEQTWTGRGRQPAWIKDALKNGRSLDEFAI